MQHSPSMRRRTLLQLGLGASVVLAVAGGALALHRPGVVDGRLSKAGRSLFRAVAAAVLEGSLPPEGTLRTAAVEAHLDRVDKAIAAFPAHLQDELSLLVSLLTHAPGRLALTGLASDWAEAGLFEVQEALQRMRESALATRQQTYLALRELTNAAYYADKSTWALLGYPGPNPV